MLNNWKKEKKYLDSKIDDWSAIEKKSIFAFIYNYLRSHDDVIDVIQFLIQYPNCSWPLITWLKHKCKR